jgi:hypothetical protein
VYYDTIRGIADDRSKDSDVAFFAYNNLKLQSAPRKLKEKDVIKIILDLTEGFESISITVNEGEFSYTFAEPLSTPPKGDPSEYWFGATFGRFNNIFPFLKSYLTDQ